MREIQFSVPFLCLTTSSGLCVDLRWLRCPSKIEQMCILGRPEQRATSDQTAVLLVGLKH